MSWGWKNIFLPMTKNAEAIREGNGKFTILKKLLKFLH